MRLVLLRAGLANYFLLALLILLLAVSASGYGWHRGHRTRPQVGTGFLMQVTH